MSKEKIFFVASHVPPKELLEKYEVFEMPTELKEVWGDIPKANVSAYLEPLIEYILILNIKHKFDKIVIGGEPRACHIMANYFKDKAYAAYSKRNSVDEAQPDGSIVKRAVFRFEGLVPYEF